MNNEIEEENKELKITPKKSEYFQNRLLYIKSNKNQNYFLNSSNKKNQYFSNNNNKDNNISLNFFKFNNKILREAIILNSFKQQKKDISILVKRTSNGNKKLKLLEKDIDLYSPEYKRLFSTQIFNSKTKHFNQNKTYERLIRNNIKKFLFSETNEKVQKSLRKALILDKKNNENNNSKNNSVNNYIYNSTINKYDYDYMQNKSKTINEKKIRPKSTIEKNDIDKKYKMKYNMIYRNDKKQKENINDRNRFKINIVNFSLELNNISNILEDNNIRKIEKSRDIFYERTPIEFFPVSDRNYFFNKKAKESFKNKRINISFDNNKKIRKNKIYIIKNKNN